MHPHTTRKLDSLYVAQLHRNRGLLFYMSSTSATGICVCVLVHITVCMCGYVSGCVCMCVTCASQYECVPVYNFKIHKEGRTYLGFLSMCMMEVRVLRAAALISCTQKTKKQISPLVCTCLTTHHHSNILHTFKRIYLMQS